MYKIKKKAVRSCNLITPYPGVIGEPLEMKLKRVTETGVGVEKILPLLYDEKYQQGYDIRTDRFEVALDALCKIDSHNAHQVAEAQKAAAAELAKKTVVEGTEATDL